MTVYLRRDGSHCTEEEALDAEGLLRDGFGVRLPLMLRDGVRRVRNDTYDAALADSLLVTDGFGGAAGLHRPGPRLPVMDADMIRRRRVVEDAYREAERADAEAWRHPKSPTDAASRPAEVPDHLTADALAMMDAKERAYAEARWHDENAWRNPRP